MCVSKNVLSKNNTLEENNEYLRSVLPVWGKEGHGNKGTIDWKNSIGCTVEYEYEWYGKIYTGSLTISRYENRHIYFEGFEKSIKTGDLQRCTLGGILFPKENRIGERNLMNCGMEAEIITYRNASDIDIKFDDGTIVEHRQYREFRNGIVLPKNKLNSETHPPKHKHKDLPIKSSFNILNLLKDYEMTIEELSEITGLTYQTIYLLPNKKTVRLNTMNKIVKALGIGCNLYDYILVEENGERIYSKLGIVTREENKKYKINISALYEATEMSLKEFAETIGENETTTKNLITGKAKEIKFRTIDNLLNELNCSLEDIFN